MAATCGGVTGCGGRVLGDEEGISGGDGGGSDASSGPRDPRFEGIWLIGWSGGLNHFSWVRLVPGGRADFFPGRAPDNEPLWDCTGTGTWRKPGADTIDLALPKGCGLAPAPQITRAELTFEFRPATDWPKGAVLQASIETKPSVPVEIQGFKFPATQCNDKMSSCKSPFE